MAQYPGPGSQTSPIDYADAYRTIAGQCNTGEFRYPNRRRAFQDILRRIVKFLDPHGLALLDIGSGDGHFLSLCEQFGFNVTGVEPSRQLASFSSSKIRGKIVCGTYGPKLFNPKSFDIITLIQVLEHFHHPHEILVTAYAHLKPGGLIVVEVPSIRSPHFIAYRMTRCKRFVAPPEGVIPSHIGYFSPQSMRTIMQRSGFSLVELRTGRWGVRYPGIMSPLLRLVDPIINGFEIGGILYMGKKVCND